MAWKLLVLCGLLLAAAPRARAVDPTPAQETYDPADLNSDGTVTNKEKRQKRRADRRARRAASPAASLNNGSSDDADDASDQQQDAAATSDSSSRGAKASANASKAASALKSSLPTGGAGAMPGGGGPGGAGGPGGGSPGGEIGGDLRGGALAGGQIGGTSGSASKPATFPAGTGAGGGPAHPTTQADFALAARSPYAPAFAASGLKLGPDGKTVLRLDGSPATADDYARLQKAISSMPEALSRRPDFFSAVSPEHYSDLKNGIKDEKHAGVYKDVGTTAGDRDFVHTASCDKLSGDCNKSVEKASYKKGDFVAPEDLDAMWSALQKELDGSAQKTNEDEGKGMPSLSSKSSQLAQDAAMNTALGLSNELDGGSTASASTKPFAGAAARSAGAATIAGATGSAKRLWKTLTMGLPGADGKAKSGTGLLLLIGAAAGMLALAGVVIVRRKG